MSLYRTVPSLVGALGLGALTWGSLIEPKLFKLQRLTVPVLPERSDPLRVLHLSDLHLAPWQRKKISWVRNLSRLRPDLIVLTGDLLGHRNTLSELRNTLEPFAGIPGVFVYGSNDYYSPVFKNPLKYLMGPSRLSTRVPDLDTPSLSRLLISDLGFLDLNNASAKISISGRELVFFGLGDPHIRYDYPEKMAESLLTTDHDGTLCTRIGVVHAPYSESLNELLSHNPDIIFSGHTHGGQVRIPGIGALTSNSDLPVGSARGLSVWRGENRAAFLHVSAGLGNSIYAPVRFACRPEATLLTFTPKGS